METLHNELRSTLSWYDRWHGHAHSSAVAWGIFLTFATLATLITLHSIDRTYLSLDVDTQLGAVASSLNKRSPVAEDAVVARVRTLTNDALIRVGEYTHATNASTPPSLDALKQVLTDRKNAIRETAKTNPNALAGLLFDQNAITAFPEEVRSLIEKPFKKSGTYKIALVTTAIQDGEETSSLLPDSQNEAGYEEYILEVGNNERYTLLLTQNEAYRIAPETTITVTGADIGESIVIPTAPLEAGEWDGDGEVLGASTIKKIAVIAFNFTNNAVQPLTTAEIRARIFTNTNSTNAYFKETSYGQWEIQGRDTPTGDVYGWVTIPVDANGTCDYNGWASKAQQELVNQGVNLSGYTNIQYVFPPANTGCSWAGLAYLGGSTSWVRADYINSRTPAHELGHNFGFHHSAKYNCSVAVNVTPSTCASSEYGDPYDLMGASTRQTNNFNKAKYWLAPAQMQTVTASGVYQIESLEPSSSGVKLLRLKRPFTSSLGTYSDGYYQIEKRGQSGVFGSYSATDPAVNGVIVRLVGDYLNGGGRKTFFVRTLILGESLVDTEAGITIALEGSSTSTARVAITKTGPACVRNAPTVSITPTSAWVHAGTLVPYTISVTNNDSEGCAPATFTITSTLPDGFSQSPATLAISGNPLTTNSGTISILSPLTAMPATYPVGVRVSHDAVVGSAIDTVVNYNVVPVDTVAPIVTISQPTDGAKITGRKIIVSVSATDTSGISKIDVVIDGKIMKTCSLVTLCSYSWNTNRISAGSHVIEGIVTDASPTANKGQAKITVTK